MLQRGGFSRSRDLEKMNSRFGDTQIQQILDKATAREKNVSVLEVGCGEGRVLMQLRKLYPDIELHGINKKPWDVIKDDQSLLQTGTFYEIFKDNEVTRIKLPHLHFYDAEKLDFNDNNFDLIISQVAVHYIKRKDLFLQEVWRTLKPNGKALLHIDNSIDINGPDFLQYQTPRFIIYKYNKVMQFKEYIVELNNNGYDIQYFDHTNIQTAETNDVVLIITKNNNNDLALDLKFDELSSFDISRLNEDEIWGEYYWGYRSVFKK
jgi:ubiquinone/menaquinone biosynthesis C-methylase UbiE